MFLSPVRKLRTKIKSYLMRFPFFYEFVQSIIDYYSYLTCSLTGSFAQHGEDIEILRLLNDTKQTGPYIDIGCNHPFRLSNTFLLYLNGWRGLCVDPLPRFAMLFKKWRPEDKFECIGIAEKAGAMLLYEFEADVFSTFDAILAKHNQLNGIKLRREVSTRIASIDSLLSRHRFSPPISFLSIDVEGGELSALRSIDLERWRPAFICLEILTPDKTRNDEAVDYLTNSNYTIETDYGTNILFRRDNFLNSNPADLMI